MVATQRIQRRPRLVRGQAQRAPVHPFLSDRGAASTSIPISNSCSIVANPWRRTRQFFPSASPRPSPYTACAVHLDTSQNHLALVFRQRSQPESPAGGAEYWHPLPNLTEVELNGVCLLRAIYTSSSSSITPTDACSSVRLAMYCSTMGRTMRGNCAEST